MVRPEIFIIMEVVIMALNQWSRKTLVLVVSVCTLGGFLLGSSSSQDAGPAARAGAVGRYQMVNSSGGLVVIDTMTARYWERIIRGGDASLEEWHEHRAPWEQAKK